MNNETNTPRETRRFEAETLSRHACTIIEFSGGDRVIAVYPYLGGQAFDLGEMITFNGRTCFEGGCIYTNEEDAIAAVLRRAAWLEG